MMTNPAHVGEGLVGRKMKHLTRTIESDRE
jgi:hypothetical protein